MTLKLTFKVKSSDFISLNSKLGFICKTSILFRHDSSVECGERGQRYFRFALRSPGESLLVKKGGVLGCFWGFSAPRKAGRLGKWRKNKRAANQRPSLAQTWPLYIYTIERTFVLAYLINIYI